MLMVGRSIVMKSLTARLRAGLSLGLARRSLVVQGRRLCAGPPHQSAIWSGLDAWRNAEVDLRRAWTDQGAAEGRGGAPSSVALPDSLVACGERVLRTADPLEKARITHAAYMAFRRAAMQLSLETIGVRH